jgi:hypothetical protein
MVQAAPRDMREWMRASERRDVENRRGIRSIVASAIGDVTEVIDQNTTRHPTGPIELTYQTAIYIDTSNRRRVRFLMDFPDVTKATDGTDIPIQQYELWAKEETPGALTVNTSAAPSLALPGATLPGLASTLTNEAIEAEARPWELRSTNPESFFRAEGFIPGSVWRFRARAIGVSTVTPGEWSSELVVQMLADAMPPPQPTVPVLKVERGTITATWDGQSVSGAMPADFKYAILAHGTASSPTFEIARFGRGGGFKVIANLPYYDPQFFRLQAVDETGNKGPWSEQAVGYTTPLVDKDIILSTIDAAKTHLKNINAGVSILPNTIITEHLVVTEEMTAALANFLHVKADMLEVNEIWADAAWFGVADAILVRSDMFEGKSFFGGTFTGGLFQTDVEDYTGIKFDFSGLKAWSAGGVNTFTLDASTGNVSIGDGVFTGGMYQSVVAANSGVKLSAAGLKIWNASAQLVIDATPTSATFTGTIKSGFGTVHASISDNTGIGRPGLKLPVNGTDYWAPQVVSVSPSEGYNEGTMLLTGARTSSSSWYSYLSLSRGGEWQLGNNNGSTGAGRIFASGDYVKIEGGGSGFGVLQVSSTAAWMQVPNAIVQVESNGAITLSGGGTTIFGGLSVSGSKNFVMDHPLHEGMELRHGSTESPVSGIEYWGTGVVGPKGKGQIVLPEYFEALAKVGNRAVLVTSKRVPVDWTDIINGVVEVSGPPGTSYSWLVKAERHGGDFEIEQTKGEIGDIHERLG